MEVNGRSTPVQMDSQLAKQSTSFGPKAQEFIKNEKERDSGTSKLTQTPNNERFHALYMQHADGNTYFWTNPTKSSPLLKNGSIDSQEAFNIDQSVKALLRKDPDNIELKEAKKFTELVEKNFDVISKLDGTNDSISDKDLEIAFGTQPHLTGPKLGGQDLRNTSLVNENLVLADLRFTDLGNANLSGADLSGANLIGGDLSRADLSGANLSGANLIGGDLSRADLSGANLSGANLTGVDLRQTNLSGADLTGANLFGADLSRADLSGANITGANLTGVSSGATYDENTIFSDDFNPFQHGMVNKNGIGSTINQSGTYNGTSGTERVFLDGDNLDITVNGNAGEDSVTLSTTNSNVNINTGDGNDFISTSIKGSGGASNLEGSMKIDRTNNQVVIDGGAGYDVLETDFQLDPKATVTKNEDGSYTMRSGNDTYTVRNIEEFVDDQGNRIQL